MRCAFLTKKRRMGNFQHDASPSPFLHCCVALIINYWANIVMLCIFNEHQMLKIHNQQHSKDDGERNSPAFSTQRNFTELLLRSAGTLRSRFAIDGSGDKILPTILIPTLQVVFNLPPKTLASSCLLAEPQNVFPTPRWQDQMSASSTNSVVMTPPTPLTNFCDYE